MAQWVKKSILGMLILLAGLVGSILFIKSIDFNDYKNHLVQAVYKTTGRTLRIDGTLELKFSMHPFMTATGIHFANARWSHKENMLNAKRIDMQVEVLPLLSGRIIINNVMVIEPDIILEISKAGKGNWVLGGASQKNTTRAHDQGQFVLPEFRHLLIRRGRIRYINHQEASPQQTFLIKNMVLRSGNLDEQLTFNLSSKYKDTPFKVSGIIASLRPLINNQRTRITLDANIAKLHVSLKGMVDKPLQGKGVHLDFHAKNKDGLLDIKGKFSGMQKGYHVKNISMQWGKNDLQGSVSIQTDGLRPAIHGKLSSQRMNIDRLLNMQNKVENNTPPPTKKIFPSTPISFDALKFADIRMAYHADSFMAQGIPFQSLDMNAVLKNETLDIRPLSAQLDSGHILVQLKINGHQEVPQIHIDIDAKKLNAEKLLTKMNIQGLSGGSLDTNIHLSAQGNTVAQIMSNLNGQLTVMVKQAKINNHHMNIIGGDMLVSLYHTLNPFTKKEDQTRIHCGVVNFGIQDGIMHTRKGVVMETSRINIIGSGVINLHDETLDMNITTEPRDGIGINIGNLVNMVRLGGTLANPQTKISPLKVGMSAVRVGGAIATGGLSLLGEGLLNRITADSHPCQTAMKGSVGKQR